MSLADLRGQLPEYAKDLRLNLDSVLTEAGAPGLAQKQIAVIALASAIASRYAPLTEAIAEDAARHANAEELGAKRHVLALHRAGEPFVLHLFDRAPGFNFRNGLARLDERAGGEEAGELVAGEQGAVQVALRFHAGVVGVGEDGVEHLLRPAMLAQVGDTYEGVFRGRGVLFVVEVVQKAGSGVQVGGGFGIGAGPSGLAPAIGLAAKGDAESVFAEAFAFGPLLHEGEGLVSHGALLIVWGGLWKVTAPTITAMKPR